MKRTGSALVVGIAVIGATVLATPAHAESLEVYAGTATIDASTADGGAMTARSMSQSAGGDDPHHPGTIEVDHYGLVGSETPVEAGATYEVTVTFVDGVAEETTTGTDATARGYGEVELYNCCFAGEMTFLVDETVEFDAATGDATLVMEYTPYEDMTLNIQSSVHAYAATSTARVGTAEVVASSTAVTVDVTEVAPAPTDPDPGTPAAGGGLGLCLLGICL